MEKYSDNILLIAFLCVGIIFCAVGVQNKQWEVVYFGLTLLVIGTGYKLSVLLAKMRGS